MAHVYLTPKEVAHRLRLKVGTVYRLLADGKIAGVRRGDNGNWLITPEAADAYLASPRGPAPPPTAEARRRHDEAARQLEATGRYRVQTYATYGEAVEAARRGA